MAGQVVQFGLLRAGSLAAVTAEEDAVREQAQRLQAAPPVAALAAHVRQAFTQARTAKQTTVEPRMLAALRARHGLYDDTKLAQIREQGGSEVFANLTSVKCRAAASWVKDIMLSGGSEKPWSIRPSPVPDLPAASVDLIIQAAGRQIQAAEQGGQQMTEDQVSEMVQSMHAQVLERVRQWSRDAAEQMEAKMEDQLAEGGFLAALSGFIDDITTFPAAILKGPVVRRRPRLQWLAGQDGSFTPQVQDQLVLEFERVSPFNIYPSAASAGIDDGYLIERIRYSPEDLDAMIGVDGYDPASIRTALGEFSKGGLREWLNSDVALAAAEGKSTASVSTNPDNLIDALQFWGVIHGQTLIDYGMDRTSVPDATKPYHVEIQIIGNYVIKAVLNYDPLHRKPYCRASYEEVPGSFWGNSVADLVSDSQQVVNASARSLVNNMAMSSGPQVAVNIDRLPDGEEISTLTPWRVWQVKQDPTGAVAAPVSFFQPQSNVQDLIMVFKTFSDLADEYSGVPKYMSGDSPGGGAGRTASGLSMLMGNAGKALKQVVANIDLSVLTPLLTRLYTHNMRYATDPALKGDVNIIARGAASLISKDAAQVRRNEFLAQTANPVDMQIVGVEGRAALLRESAKTLDMDPDRVVPPLDVLRQRMAAAAVMSQAAQAEPGTIPGAPPALPGQSPEQAGGPTPSGQTLTNGAPVTDHFSPPRGG